jgi:hypothetical protein
VSRILDKSHLGIDLPDDLVGKLSVKIPEADVDSTESQLVSEILGASGVRYRHRNSDVVATSRVAEQEAEELKVRTLFPLTSLTGPTD